jgi:hypothetical protein
MNFTKLGDHLFSLGQDDSYYERLNNLGVDACRSILESLNDVAWNLELSGRALDETVTGVSLLRSVPKATVRNQFHRMAHGEPQALSSSTSRFARLL